MAIETIEYELEDGSIVEYDVESPDQQISNQTQVKSPVEKVVSGVNTSITNPLNPITGITPGLNKFNPISPIADVARAGISAERNYPAQNLLPAIGGMIGSVSPLGVVGTALGASAGEAGRQIISRMRGQESPQTSGEAFSKIAKTGGEAALFDSVGKLAFRTIEGLMAKGMARKGMDSFKGYIDDLVKPESKKLTEEALEEIKDIPKSADAMATQEVVGEILEKRGMSYKPSASAIRQKMMNEADLSPKEIFQLSEDLARAKTPKVVSDLQTPKLSEYQKLGDILDDLSQKDLTYGKMKQMQTTVGDLANFQSAERDTVEKMYGAIYKAIGDDMSATAKAGGFLDKHKFIYKNGQKYHQGEFLYNLFQKNRDFTPYGEEVNYGKLAHSLNKYNDRQLDLIFGERVKEIKALRDVVNNNAKTFRQEVISEPRATTHGNIWSSLHPTALINRLRYPEHIAAIAERRGVPEIAEYLVPKNLGIERSVRGTSVGIPEIIAKSQESKKRK